MVCRTWLLLFLGSMTCWWRRWVVWVRWRLNTSGAAIVALVSLTCLTRLEALIVVLNRFNVVVTWWLLLNWTRGASAVTWRVALQALALDTSKGAMVDLRLWVKDRTCGLGLMLLAMTMLSTSGM